MPTWTSSRARWIAAWEQGDEHSSAARRSMARQAAKRDLRLASSAPRGAEAQAPRAHGPGSRGTLPAELAGAAVRASRATAAGAVALALEEATLRPDETGVASLPEERARVSLRVVPRRRVRWILTVSACVFLLTVFSSLILGPLALNSMSTKADWQLAQLQQREDDLKASIATLSARLASLTSTGQVVEEAQRLGLAPASRVRYVNVAALKSSGSPGAPVVAEGGSLTDAP